MFEAANLDSAKKWLGLCGTNLHASYEIMSRAALTSGLEI